jgi:ribose transport system substrate-binding protein
MGCDNLKAFTHILKNWEAVKLKLKNFLLVLLICIIMSSIFSNISAASKLMMGISYYTTEIPTLNQIVDGAKRKGQELGYKVNLAVANFDINKQINDVENFIQMGCKVILINPVDSAGVVPAVQACNRANVPVIMLDIDAKDGVRAAHVTSDNKCMGRYGGEFLAWKLKGKGKIAMLDYPQLDIVKERSDAFQEVIKHFPDIQIVAVEHAVTRAQGLDKMENILQAHPDLDGVYTINDGGGLGTYYAAQAAGKKFVLASVDGEEEAIALVKLKNSMYGVDTSHFTTLLGKLAATVADKAVKGQPYKKKTVNPVFPVTYESSRYFPGCTSETLPSIEKLIPSWYKEKSWRQIAENYNGWRVPPDWYTGTAQNWENALKKIMK